MNTREALQDVLSAILPETIGQSLYDAARAALASAPVLVSVKIRHEIDPDPDLSHLGRYSNEPGPEDRTIDCTNRGKLR